MNCKLDSDYFRLVRIDSDCFASEDKSRFNEKEIRITKRD